MGHGFLRQHYLIAPKNNKSRYRHGGVLRNLRGGRGTRPLSTKSSVHLVFKVDVKKIKRGFRSPLGFKICRQTIKKYSRMFAVKIEQLAICQDHIHILIRLSRRSNGLHFFRVVAGQIAQLFKKYGLWVTDTHRKYESTWKHRPFTRVVFGKRAYGIARNYVKLNNLESEGKIPYRKGRTTAITPEEWARFGFIV